MFWTDVKFEVRKQEVRTKSLKKCGFLINLKILQLFIHWN